jgi:CHRD domain
MRLPKLTALFLGLSMIALTSCKSTEEVEQDNIYVGSAIPMSGSQETPAVTTAATGSIDANYNRLTRTLSYKVSWSGLSGNVTNMHIHGTGEVGVLAGVFQTFSGWAAAPAGTYSGTVLIDGVKFTENDLLAKRYYINIHTALNPAGEIRGQLILNKK